MSRQTGNPIVSVSGVRGVVGAGLYPEDVAGWGAAFGTLCGGGVVLIGRDTRASGPMIQAALTSGLLSVGADAVDLGMCPTPTVQMAVPEGDAAGGVVVTASHNPAEWNALKFVGPSGRFLDRSGLEDLIRIKQEGSFGRKTADSIGRMRVDEGAVDFHLRRILELDILDVEAIRRAGVKVAIDGCNGAGSLAGPALLKKLGCEVFPFNCDPEGSFPRGPEPTSENLKGFEKEVSARRADVGFAVDPDADRLAFVTEEGIAPGEEFTLPLAVGYVLRRRPGPLAVNLSTSAMVDCVARSFGCAVHRSPVGEANVVSLMIEKDCVVGGEGNGGVILPELHHGRDSLVGMALLLGAIAEAGEPVSSLCGRLPQYTMLKTKVSWGGADPARLMRLLSEKWSSAELNVTDGIKAVWTDRWVHLRASGTEPVLRVIAEAPDQAAAEALIAQAKQCIGEPES